MEKDEVEPTLQTLEQFAENAMIVGCPFGEFEHSDTANPYEKHLCAVYPDMLRNCGLSVEAIGEADTVGSQLIGWTEYAS